MVNATPFRAAWENNRASIGRARVRVDKTDADDLQLFLVDPGDDLCQPLLALG